MSVQEYGLSTGFIKSLFTNVNPASSEIPFVVQVVNYKAVDSGDGSNDKRVRMLACDGEFSIHCVLRGGTYLKHAHEGLEKYNTIEVTDYYLEIAKHKHVIIIDDYIFKQRGVPKLVPSPMHIDEYFQQHPNEDRLVLQAKGISASPPPQAAQPAQPPVQPIQQKQQAPKQTGPNSSQHANISAIEQLSPYQNNWKIKARVSFKGDMKTWSNQKGEGKLFNINLLDESDEIRATAFNDIADKFYDVLQEGKVYYVSKARMQVSKRQFSHLSHAYELQFDRDTEIEECFDASDVPKLQFSFTKLDTIQNLEANAIIDVIGVIKKVDAPFQITSKSTGRPFDRRDITIVDDSQFAINVGLWNKAALDFDLPEGSVVAFKGAKVQDFGGRSLSLTPSATTVSNPDYPEAYQLKGWYDNQGVNEKFSTLKSETGNQGTGSISERKTIIQAQDEDLGMKEKPDYFSIKASISFIRTENFCYPACNNEGCNRKVVEQSDGTWRCEKCDVNHPTPNYRYILSLSVVDRTSQIWLTLFDDTAKELLGVTAGELMALKENSDESSQFQDTLSKAQMSEKTFRIRARQDSYNGQVRVRYNAVAVSSLDYNSECDFLAEKLKSLLN